MQSEPTAPYLLCVWIGGFFYWTLQGFAGKYNDQLTDKRRSINFWTGYVINMLIFTAAIYMLYYQFAA